MKSKFSTRHIIFVIVITLLIIPNTRKPIQVLLHKGLSFINQSSIIEKDERKKVSYGDWMLQSDSDRILEFRDTKEKIVFINLWATWCPPCIAEMPSLQALYDDYKEKVIFLFITNEEFKIVENFKAKKNFNFEVYHPLSEIPLELSTSSIPRTFIINKSGEIVVDESGAVDWNSKKVRNQLDQLLLE